MNNPAYIVETSSGNRGLVKKSDGHVNGKILLYLQDENGQPKMDATTGKQRVLLVQRKNIKKILAFIN